MNSKLHPYLLMILALAIPIFRLQLGFIMIAVAINWLIGLLRKEFALILSHRHVLMLVGYYLIHAVSMAWTENSEDGMFDLQVKLPLLLMPIVVGTNGILKAKDLKNIAYAFLAGTFLASMINIVWSLIDMSSGAESAVFFGREFSRLLHLGYFALCLNIAIAILFAILFRNWKYMTRTKAFMILGLVMFFALMVVLTTSKNGMITLFGLLFVTGVYAMLKYRLWRSGLIIFVLITGMLAAVISTSRQTRIRFEKMFEAMTTEQQVTPDSDGSTALRMFAWESSLEVIGENPILGVGTGDVEDELVQKYMEHGYIGAEERRLNAHNQFLQTFAGVGVIGFVLLVIILLHPIRVGWQRGSYVLMAVGIMTFVFALTESIFEVQSGVVIFIFFVSIYLFAIPERYAKRDAFLLIR